ncbi:DNA polymerase III subunit delta [Citrobacter koseri]|uniref:DNA polymerase III subunit delta n=1 Tax=Citrobacter koseri TaxID=545 RepID=A0A3S4M980_CITKO|nr:DNA polymerase III subunit delta [Citrobacter koseri]
MIRLYPEQLRAQLNEGLRAAYLLLGNDPLLLQESQDAIRLTAAAQGFEEHHAFTIDTSTDWGTLFLTVSGNEPVCQPSNAAVVATGKWPECGDQ